MIRPVYISVCAEDVELKEAMVNLVESVSANIQSGYELSFDAVVQHVTDGMTVDTYNQLAQNINKLLSDQVRSKENLRFIKKTDHVTVH